MSNSTANDETVSIEQIDGLFGYAMVLTRNRSEAEDLVQETYARALAAITRLRPKSNLKSWLFTILRNVWLNDRRRRTAVETDVIDLEKNDFSLEVKAGDDPHELYIREMNYRQVRAAIEQLPLEMREIIVLRAYEELSYQQIAQLLNCPIGTVMSRLARARMKLRAALTIDHSALRSDKNLVE